MKTMKDLGLLDTDFLQGLALILAAPLLTLIA